MVDTIDVHDLPEEQASLVREFVEFLRKKLKAERPKKERVKKVEEIPVHPVKANTFLKHTGIISVGGDAVKESGYYDE